MKKLNKAFALVATTLVVATGVSPLMVSGAALRSGSNLVTGNGGAAPDAAIDNFRLSSDGKWATFSSDATNLVADDTNEATDVFVINLDTNAITRLSVFTNGTEGYPGEASMNPTICGSGQYVAFESLVGFDEENDYNSTTDIYVVNRDADVNGTFDEYDVDGGVTITRISVGSGGDEVWDAAQNAAISDNCAWVAYDTTDVLEANDGNVDSDVYANNVSGTSNVLISSDVTPSGSGGGGELASISSTGRYISFITSATDLVQEGGNSGVVLIDRDSNRNSVFDEASHISREYISKSTGGTASSGTPDASAAPAMTPDGNCVAFKMVSGSDLDSSFVASNGIYLRNRSAGTTELISIGNEVDGITLPATESAHPAISSDCRFVTFDSGDEDLIPGDTNSNTDVFLRDLTIDYTTLVSATSAGVTATGESMSAAVLPFNSTLSVFVLSSAASVAGSISTNTYAAPVRVNMTYVAKHTLTVANGQDVLYANGAFTKDDFVVVTQNASGLLSGNTVKIQRKTATPTSAGSFRRLMQNIETVAFGNFFRQNQSDVDIEPGQTLCFTSSVEGTSLIDEITTPSCVARPLSMSSSLITRSANWTSLSSGTKFKSTVKTSTLTLKDVTGRKFAIVADKCAACGTISVKFGDKTAVTVNLAGATASNVVIPVNIAGITRATKGDLTITVTSTNKAVTIGGIGIARY